MTAATRLARLGLIARTGFYAVLAYLCVAVAVQGGSRRQTNAHGALALITSNDVGKALVAAAAVGFAAFAVVRIIAGARDREGSTWQRTSAVLQGGFYLAVAVVPLSFLLGRRQSGSERQQHKEASDLMGVPGGELLVIAAGVIVLAVCVVQIRTALRTDFTNGMRLRDTDRWARRAIVICGKVGIIARALVFAPVGGFLIAAGLLADPGDANGLDAELADLSAHSYGPAVLGAVAAGLAVFAAYSALEARYRELESSK